MSEQVASAAELDALLVGSVIRCDDNEGIGLNVAERQPSGWCYVGSSLRFTAAQVAADEMRFAVLYRPDQPQRVQPRREDMATALIDTRLESGGFANLNLHQACQLADAVLALFVQQPTVAEVKAEALREAAGRASRMYAGTDGTEAERNWISGLSAVVRMLTSEADRIEREARP